MSVTISKTGSVVRILAVDALLLCFICVIPALFHMTSLPLYKLNPMTMCLLVGILLVRDRRNGYLLAVLLPLVSMLVSGMPVPMKALCMVPELLSIVFVYGVLERRIGVFGAVLSALLAGKIVYYALKAVLVSPLVLVGTNIWLQVVTVLMYGGLFALVKKLVD